MARHLAPRRSRLLFLLLGLGAALGAVACADDSGKSASTAFDRGLAGSGSSAAAAASGASGTASRTGASDAPQAAGGATGAAGAIASAAPLTPGAEVVYTGSLDVRVDDVDAAARDAQAKVSALGGYLFSQRSATSGAGPSATLVFKLPPANFVGAVDSLATLGTETSRNLQADDVTAQVVDLEARLKTAQASLERTRALLDKAAGMSDIVTLEREVAARETTVEQIQGQLRVLRAQVAAATLTLTIAEKAKAAPPTPSKDIPSALDGLRAGAVALVNTLQVVVLVLAAALPWLVPALALWWIGRRVVRVVTARVAARRRPPGPGA